jgi:uncharacterized membrane protein
MAHANFASRSRTARIWHADLVQFPVVCFTLALLTDLAYWWKGFLMWHNFSAWLLFAGLGIGCVALLAGAIELIARPFFRRRTGVGRYVLGSLIVLALAFVNNLVHAADGWWGVMPWGLLLSSLTVIAMIATAWLSGGSLRPRVLQQERGAGHA